MLCSARHVRSEVRTGSTPGPQRPQDFWQDLSMKLGFRPHSPLLAHCGHLSCTQHIRGQCADSWRIIPLRDGISPAP